MNILRIKDWEHHFENNRTREVKKMSWLPIPIKHDGDGFTELMNHKDGAAHFGAWLLLVQVAAKCDERGTLLRANGRPHDSTSLERITRCAAKVFDAAIPRLLSHDIGWLEVVDADGVMQNPPEGATISHPAATIEESTGEEKREQGKTAFSLFWESYPKKTDKKKARIAFNRQNLADKMDAIMPALELQKQSKQWREGVIPHPTTWINGERWEDDLGATEATGGEPKRVYIAAKDLVIE